jgi:hypothetical protein
MLSVVNYDYFRRLKINPDSQEFFLEFGNVMNITNPLFLRKADNVDTSQLPLPKTF